ncbi:MAG: tRNA preQ1(34) S-adenosylmethionine ribosyltransferase-isomerase QueA [Cyanobacteria bacterium REEB444]|nr:tRNA preQ1(34) S-adenosylmethionine ribosyltransferase-isomerase QueA [Cyanobacteria bacterium REEB444]
MEKNKDLYLSSYDYELPPSLIAQDPVNPRDHSRLLVVHSTKDHDHRFFYDLPNLLKPGDLLVINNTKVIPARLYGQKLDPLSTSLSQSTPPHLSFTQGGGVEVLLLEQQTHNHWLALVKPGKRLKPGVKIVFNRVGIGANESDYLTATVIDYDLPTGGRVIEFHLPPNETLMGWLSTIGQIPLPPYITQSQATSDQYQTVYASQPGAVAAPTAGLHFTPELLKRLDRAGITKAEITLHVGVGTFRPVEVEDVTEHVMHAEWIEVLPAVVAQIKHTKAQGGRIIAVGTTVVRSLEAAYDPIHGEISPFCGKTDLFIYPGYPWQVVDGLITNFHLPKSSLLMLVSSLIGRQRLLALYQEAILHQYRFYSFGDAMLILPSASIQSQMAQ